MHTGLHTTKDELVWRTFAALPTPHARKDPCHSTAHVKHAEKPCVSSQW